MSAATNFTFGHPIDFVFRIPDRKDNMKDMAKFAGRQQLQPSDIAETMLKMVESKEYDGGTCVLKTPYEEKIQEDGYTKQVEKMKEYDPVSIVIPSEVS